MIFTKYLLKLILDNTPDWYAAAAQRLASTALWTVLVIVMVPNSLWWLIPVVALTLAILPDILANKTTEEHFYGLMADTLGVFSGALVSFVLQDWIANGAAVAT